MEKELSNFQVIMVGTLWVMGMFTFTQWVYTLIMLYANEYRTKKEFFMALIPFYYMVDFIQKIKDLE